MRRLLKARELGLPEGDLSTLETTSDDGNAPTSRGCRRGTCAGAAAQMLRIRRFEEQCAELYSAGKIRGFLHLYIGEEAVAVGVVAGARAATTRRRHLPRARPRPAARRAR